MHEILKTELMAIANHSELAFIMKSSFYLWLRICKQFFKAGVVEGTYFDANGMKEISSIPSRDILLGRLLGSMQSPIANLARVLNQIAENGGEAVVKEETAEESAE